MEKWERGDDRRPVQPPGVTRYEDNRAGPRGWRLGTVIAHEHNYVLNTRHPDFGQLRIAGWEDFAFDARIKEGGV